MLWKTDAIRDNVRNRDGKRVFYLPRGDQLTSDARDYLRRERIELLPASEARPEIYRLLDGSYMTEKPEHMTHLNGDILVSKTHPRIVFRGKMDTLESELILCQLEADRFREPLGEILALARRIIRCDVMEEGLEEELLCGLTEGELRKRSHFPQDCYGVPHFMPQASDGRGMAWLNRARCAAREAELWGVRAFLDGEGRPTRPDILRALNRISSMLYILMIQEKKG